MLHIIWRMLQCKGRYSSGSYSQSNPAEESQYSKKEESHR
jgi:hypothetical protein